MLSWCIVSVSQVAGVSCRSIPRAQQKEGSVDNGTMAALRPAGEKFRLAQVCHFPCCNGVQAVLDKVGLELSDGKPSAGPVDLQEDTGVPQHLTVAFVMHIVH